MLKETVFKGWIPSDYLGKLPSNMQAFMADKKSFKMRSEGKRSKEKSLMSNPVLKKNLIDQNKVLDKGIPVAKRPIVGKKAELWQNSFQIFLMMRTYLIQIKY